MFTFDLSTLMSTSQEDYYRQLANNFVIRNLQRLAPKFQSSLSAVTLAIFLCGCEFQVGNIHYWRKQREVYWHEL
jgi:hypothetical protein